MKITDFLWDVVIFGGPHCGERLQLEIEEIHPLILYEGAVYRFYEDEELEAGSYVYLGHRTPWWFVYFGAPTTVNWTPCQRG